MDARVKTAKYCEVSDLEALREQVTSRVDTCLDNVSAIGEAAGELRKVINTKTSTTQVEAPPSLPTALLGL